MKSVYLLQSANGYYKIGVSKNPSKRISQLQTGNGDTIKLLFAHETDIPFLLEKTLKNRYLPYRVNGEWFNFPIEVEIEFKKICLSCEEMLKKLKNDGNIFL